LVFEFVSDFGFRASDFPPLRAQKKPAKSPIGQNRGLVRMPRVGSSDTVVCYALLSTKGGSISRENIFGRGKIFGEGKWKMRNEK
jgi:hypothetical protein